MEFKLKNTQEIQAESLLNFMEMLGYSPRKGGQYFEHVDASHPQARVSFKTAVALHNGSPYQFERCGGAKVVYVEHKSCFSSSYPRETEFEFKLWDFKRAQASKIVKTVKIQFKRNEGCKILSHMVEFVDPDYEISLTALGEAE